MTWAAHSSPHVTKSNISLYGCRPKDFLKGWLPSLGLNLCVRVRVCVWARAYMHTRLSQWDNSSLRSQFSDQLTHPSALSCRGKKVLICSMTNGICNSVVTSCMHLLKRNVVKPTSCFSHWVGSHISLLGTQSQWEFRVYESLSSALIELNPVPRPSHLVPGPQIRCLLCDNFQWCTVINTIFNNWLNDGLNNCKI